MNPKVALVTGANRGLGRETCRQLLAKGYRVIVSARSLQAAQQTVDQLDSPLAVAAKLDVTDVQSITNLVFQISQNFGVLDLLINNAAIHYDTWQHAVNAVLSQVREAAETNLYGPWQMVQSFLPLLRLSKAGRIVNVSSGAGALSNMSGSTPAYSLSKLALNGLTQMLAAELNEDGILVNAVCPGWVATDMGGPGGRPIEDGASGIVWAATLPDSGPSGGFFRDGKPIAW